MSYNGKTKDPIALKELYKYINFCMKLALARAHVQFLDDCIIKLKFPKQ